jgi:2-iminobutanoate/2-iminopropanoate deaminase
MPLLLPCFYSCAHHHSKNIIATGAAPAAIGPYSQAVKVGKTLYLSGQIAINPATGKLVEGGIEKEARKVLDNIGAVLKAAGMDFADVVQVQVFLKDLNHYGLVNKIYAEYFKSDFPARAALQVARLPKDVSIEVMAVAVEGAGG